MTCNGDATEECLRDAIEGAGKALIAEPSGEWVRFCLKDLRRLPSEVERENPDLEISEVWECFAALIVAAKAIEQAMKG